jgi:hypothetical protein
VRARRSSRRGQLAIKSRANGRQIVGAKMRVYRDAGDRNRPMTSFLMKGPRLSVRRDKPASKRLQFFPARFAKIA